MKILFTVFLIAAHCLNGGWKGGHVLIRGWKFFEEWPKASNTTFKLSNFNVFFFFDLHILLGCSTLLNPTTLVNKTPESIVFKGKKQSPQCVQSPYSNSLMALLHQVTIFFTPVNCSIYANYLFALNTQKYEISWNIVVRYKRGGMQFSCGLRIKLGWLLTIL